MTSIVPFHLTEVAKPRVRAASLELSSRVLRAVGMEDAAGYLDSVEPGALSRGSSPHLAKWIGPHGASAIVEDAATIARSMRRGSLRYGALKLRRHGVHLEAAELLERVAAEVGLGDDRDRRDRRRGARW